MKKLLLLLMFATLGFAQTKTTVTGVVQDASGNLATSGTVVFNLSPQNSGIIYFVTGTGIIAPQTGTCGIDGSGNIKNLALSGVCQVWGTDLIQPANLTYQVAFFPNGVGSPTNTVAQQCITGATYDLSNPKFCPVIKPTPQGAVVITSPIQNNLIPSADAVFSLGSASLRYANIFASTGTFTNPISAPNLPAGTINTGTGTTNTIPKFTNGGAGTLGNSSLTDNGTNVSTGEVMLALGLNLGSTGLLSTTAQSGTGSLCMTNSCVMTTPALGAATGLSLNLSSSADMQILNGIYQAHKSTGITGAGTVGVPYSGASGQAGIGESIAAMGTALGSSGVLHVKAGYYNATVPINSTANIASVYANSSPPAPLIIEGDGQASTFIIGNTGGKVFDETGRRVIIRNLTILQGASNPSTLGVYMSRGGSGAVSQFCDGNTLENVTIDLPSVPAANGGQDTIGVYNNACEDYDFHTDIISAHQPIIITSNNVYGITSSYQTIAVNLHNFDSQGRIIGGSVTTYSNGGTTGQGIMLQGHASNAHIQNVSGECDGATTSHVFLYIKAPSAPDAVTDPLPGLHLSGMQYECPTGGTAILNEQVLTNAFIQGNVANLAATPIIQLTGSTALLKDSMVSIQPATTAVSSPMVSDAGLATAGLQGGSIFLPANTTIALTNAASTCFGTNITATYSSPTITCGGTANQDLNGIISTFNSWSLLNSGGISLGSDTSLTVKIQNVTSLVIDTTYATFSKPTALTETTAPAASAGKDVCYGDSTAHAQECSYNNDAFKPITRTIASGTASMTTALIAAGACGTTVTVAATGVLTTDVVDFARNAAATSGNGGILIPNSWPTAGNVNFNYCNPGAAGITPTAATINWTVTR